MWGVLWCIDRCSSIDFGLTNELMKMVDAVTSPLSGASSSSPLGLHYGVAMLLRTFLSSSLSHHFDVGNRPEVATPINSYLRLTEGVALRAAGVDPYQGALFHEPPIILEAATIGELDAIAALSLSLLIHFTCFGPKSPE